MSPFLEQPLALCAHLDYLAAEFMADDSRILRDIVGDPFMLCTLHGRFVGGHADAVGDDFDNNLVVLHGGELKLLQPQVHFAVNAHGFCFHNRTPFCTVFGLWPMLSYFSVFKCYYTLFFSLCLA